MDLEHHFHGVLGGLSVRADSGTGLGVVPRASLLRVVRLVRGFTRRRRFD